MGGSCTTETGPAAVKSPGIWRACSQRCRRWSGLRAGRLRLLLLGSGGGYAKHGCQFIISARKTARLVEALKAAEWQRSPRTDADGQCEFRYQPEGWGQAYRFVALRYVKTAKPEAGQAEQYQLFETPDYTYRVFVTNLRTRWILLVGLYPAGGSREPDQRS